MIAIIAILAAILFPVFGRARENARRSSCQSNLKQMGLGVMQYVQDYDEKYPQAYWYVNDNNGDNGYVHWSSMIQPYTKSFQIFVCPSDANGGQLPTNTFDQQAPRISYTANSVLFPRKRRGADAGNTVALSAVDESSKVIMIAGMSDTAQCVQGTSVASGAALKSHRSTNALALGRRQPRVCRWPCQMVSPVADSPAQQLFVGHEILSLRWDSCVRSG